MHISKQFFIWQISIHLHIWLNCRAIMRYHGLKMAEINKIIKEYWINTYKGNGKVACLALCISMR